MVSKGAVVQVARVRRAEDAPAKLKKKVVAVRSEALAADRAKEAALQPVNAASPVTKPTPSPPTRAHAPAWSPPQKSPKKPAEKDAPQERADASGARPEDDAADKNGAPLITIAPATPGAILPKDLIMAKHRAKPDAPKFLLMLYEILQNESDQVIRWTDDGLALQILDQSNVTEKVLPKYFNHTNFHSFQRQLNYFGFRKWTKSKTDICTFSHPYFRRNQPELMHLIKRKKATRRASAAEQAEFIYPTEGFSGAAGGSAPVTNGPPKKLLPLSPSGKRRLAQDSNEEGESRPYLESSKPQQNGGALPVLANSIHFSSSTHSSNTHQLLPSAASLTNAISPASGGAKKKAKTSNTSKSFNPPELAPAGPVPPPIIGDSNGVGNLGISAGGYAKGSLPNLDIVRNRLIYRQPTPSSAPSPIPGFANGFQMGSAMSNVQSSGGSDIAPQAVTTPTPGSGANQPNESSSMFTNSFSDPVDILLRIKKSRAMSQDNTLVQSPQQRSQGQVEGFASLQNFLLSQSMYTNRLESQLKLALDENEALRHLLDAKQREVDALLNERKLIQNENSVLTEDKNKLFEINRDLLSKLFPQ